MNLNKLYICLMRTEAVIKKHLNFDDIIRMLCCHAHLKNDLIFDMITTKDGLLVMEGKINMN